MKGGPLLLLQVREGCRMPSVFLSGKADCVIHPGPGHRALVGAVSPHSTLPSVCLWRRSLRENMGAPMKEKVTFLK